MNNKKIRLRYAPSPTGFLHIGNTRTALFNYLWAKHYQGDFILRIEDTDLERNIDGAVSSQLDNLRWLGIFPDETIDKPGDYGPYSQLERLEIYQEYVQKLVDNHQAYYCFCSNEEIKEMRANQLDQGLASFHYDRRCYHLSSSVISEKLAAKQSFNIRFLVPSEQQYIFNDIVRGEVIFESKDIGDWVILKSNKIPTYNFAVAVDDFLMKITHVIRGEEHISNTPKQLMIYEAFNWEPPIFAHLTLIINEHHKKLSKRDKDVIQFISQYRKMGFLPQAIFNYVALLGWSPNSTQEIFTHDQLIKEFDEKRLSKSPSMFDMKKMLWINNNYLKNLSNDDYLEFIRPFIMTTYDLTNKTEEWLQMLLLIYKRELQYGEEIISLVAPFFNPLSVPSLEELLKHFELESGLQVINEFYQQLQKLSIFTEETIKLLINDIGKKLNVKGKSLFMPIRLASSYQSHGPELAKVVYLLGKEIVISNLEKVLVYEKK